MAEIGIITEQGDLGLGFNTLNKKDTAIYNESNKSSIDNTKDTEVVTESNKRK